MKKKKKKPEVAGVAGDGKETEEGNEPQGEAGLSQDDSLDSLGPFLCLFFYMRLRLEAGLCVCRYTYIYIYIYICSFA